MKVVIVELPFYNLLGLSAQTGLGCGYIASYLERAGHSVSIVNGEALEFESRKTRFRALHRLSFFFSTSLDEIPKPFHEVMTDPRHRVWDAMIEQLDKENPDIVGLSLVTVKMTGAKLLSSRIKKDLGGIPIVLGGVHPTSMPLETLAQIPEANFVVVGEGEETMKELLEYLGAPTEYELHSIKGLAYKDSEGRAVLNQPRELIADLDSLPLPKRERQRGKSARRERIITGRGCPYGCRFCASPVLWKRRARYRSVDNVLEEITMLKTLFGVERIRIVDDTFTLSKKYVLEFSQKVRERGLDSIEYSIGSRVDTIDAEMLDALKACGVEEISFGIESGSPHILQQIGKDITPEQVMQTISAANAKGILSHAFYMIGHPDETKDDIQLSKELIYKSKPSFVALNMVTIYPQTGYAEVAASKNKKLLSIDDCYKGFHQSSATVNITELTDEELQHEYVSFASLVRHYNFKRSMLRLLKILRRPKSIVHYLFEG